MLADILGVPARRKLGAGRKDDTGDIDGLADTVVQVANYTDVTRALRIKPQACEAQQHNAGAAFGVTALRMPRGRWLMVMTPGQFAQLWQSAVNL